MLTIGRKATIQTDIHLKGVPSDIEEALYYGSFAANSHNIQSWKVTVKPNQGELTVSLDKKRSLDVVDPKNRELYISLGCYIQSLKTAFEAYGYKVDLRQTSPSASNHYQAIISNYQKGDHEKNDQQQVDLIKKRHTDKRKYLARKLDKDFISQATKRYKNLHYYPRSSQKFTYLKEGSIRAVKKQSESSDFLKEQSDWLRFSNQETEKKKDGISGDVLGLNPLLKSLYFMTTNHQNATNQGFAKQSLSTLKKQVNNCAGFFVMTGKQTIEDWIATGRQVQAFWYDCTKKGIAIQPISAMIEVSDYNKNLEKDLQVDEPVQMILRAGYIESYGENSGVRRDLKDYIRVEED
ncbi:Acg family FMN-binding oxidoreductase [Streptococcus downei]|uniref:Nitroreductase family n=1 Tax=Streptococcus downei MFe28 TaxID=764290 RepID=A0A380JIV5_STRDO|nr:hypothetical protein [Streptococcus downei]EFQ58218.1 hypothetical protein HMPREF9176_2233 [Streptococcus downei F0415]SUN37357.1 Nitroreductase family [Streptococcus downei MFe28]